MLTTLPGTALAPLPFFQVTAFVRVQFRLLLQRRALWAATLISLLATVTSYTSTSWFQPLVNLPPNTTYTMAYFLAPGTGLTCVLSAFFVAGAALEDRHRRVEVLLLSRPVASLWYTLSKMGTLVAVVLGILALDSILTIAVQPWVMQTYDYFSHVFVIWPYIELYVVMAVPAALSLVPCVWLLAIATRRLVAAVAPIFIWWAIIFGTPFGLAADLFVGSHTALGTWFDPTGLAYAHEVWTEASRLHPQVSYLLHYGPVPLSGSFVASRLLFAALGVIALFVAAWLVERQRRPAR